MYRLGYHVGHLVNLACRHTLFALWEGLCDGWHEEGWRENESEDESSEIIMPEIPNLGQIFLDTFAKKRA